MKRWAWLPLAGSMACVYQGTDPGQRLEFPAVSDAARTTPITAVTPEDGGVPIDSGGSEVSGDADAAADATTFPTPELVRAGDAYQLAVRGDTIAAYNQVIVGGSLDTQLLLIASSASRVAQSGVQILARNRLLLDDLAVAASDRSGVFLHPLAGGARVDVAFGTVPQGVQLAGLGPSYVYYLRPSPVPGGFDMLRRRSRTDATDERVACSVNTSAFDVADDGFAVLGRPTGVFSVALATGPGDCASETGGTRLSALANPVSVTITSARVIVGVDGGVSTVLSAVPRAGGPTESIGASAIGLWGGEPARPLAALGDTLFYVEETGTQNFVVEHAPGKPLRRILSVGSRKVRAVGANATHVYFTTEAGVFRVPRT